MRNFIAYYRWHLIFLLLILICICFIVSSLMTKSEPDIILGYFGTEYVNEQTFNDNKAEIELLLHDSNNDKERMANLVTYTVRDIDDVTKFLEDAVETKSYHIYIAPKRAFEDFSDKAAFRTLSADSAADDTLSTSSGRVYAVSVEGNTLLRRLGFLNDDNLYIAAADFGEEEISTFEKNGANIARHIIESRTKYK